MKKLVLHINSLLIWLLLPLFFFTSCMLANAPKLTCNSISSSVVQKSIVFICNANSQSSSDEFPEDSPNKNNEISIDEISIDDVIDTLIIKNIVFYTTYITEYSTFLPIKYKESGNMQCHLDIVPPPPKL